MFLKTEVRKMRVDIPSIKVSYTKNNLEFVKEVIYGIEEEGIPYEITEEEFSDVIKKAYEESFNSSLSFGIALNDEKAAFHFSKLEEEKPLFLVNIKSMDKKDLRAYGSNAARLIKGIPFKEV